MIPSIIGQNAVPKWQRTECYCWPHLNTLTWPASRIWGEGFLCLRALENNLCLFPTPENFQNFFPSRGLWRRRCKWSHNQSEQRVCRAATEINFSWWSNRYNLQIKTRPKKNIQISIICRKTFNTNWLRKCQTELIYLKIICRLQLKSE